MIHTIIKRFDPLPLCINTSSKPSFPYPSKLHTSCPLLLPLFPGKHHRSEEDSSFYLYKGQAKRPTYEVNKAPCLSPSTSSSFIASFPLIRNLLSSHPTLVVTTQLLPEYSPYFYLTSTPLDCDLRRTTTTVKYSSPYSDAR